MVSRNWTRSSLGPGAADGVLQDEEVEGRTSTFCLGGRVELAVTMENKAEVSSVGGSPGSGGQPLLAQLCRIARTHLPRESGS